MNYLIRFLGLSFHFITVLYASDNSKKIDLEIIGSKKIVVELESNSLTNPSLGTKSEQGYQIAFSALPVPNLQFLGLQVSRRKQSFLQYFEDQIEPYTGKKNSRSTCLKSQKENAVFFLTNDLMDWGSCNPKTSNFAVRSWSACDNSLWEVTVVAPNKKNIDINLRCKTTN